MTTPFQWLAARVGFERGALRLAASAALATSLMIIVTGGVVRLTGSGLGCDGWPRCSDNGFAATPELGVHGAIEFSNRVLSGVVCVAVGWLIVVSRLQRRPVPALTRWGWVQFWIVILNAVVGGLTVWARLSPYLVAAHFLAATLFLTATTVVWHKTTLLDRPARPLAAPVGRLPVALLATVAVLVVFGTIVTGTGPHAGDSSDVPRMPFNWTVMTWLHGAAATLAFGLAVALWLRTRRDPRSAAHRRTTLFLVALLAQGLVGLTQVPTDLAEVVILAHLLGSAFVWVGAVRVLLDTRTPAAVGEKQLRLVDALR
ncbi:cytochrome oxidase assembly protein [Nonomuraea sp. WAC 01424]|uniref:COX15/CtaA family protein n=1 Tax=Nonomuraea sp. WAC 01424 TaxID=2203200 RepID=UPI000F77F859|nr:COX15/CtaA family protein [Nonomuraea sp. WAC 01424]RSN15779.1 cytochrome oxidase assembly protein [Nonomuraea sp. WAC 01424]